MAKNKKDKHKKPEAITLSEEEINEFIAELREQEEYAGLDEETLRIKAIERLFEEYDQ